MKKKILALTLALAAVLSLSACGKNPSANAGPVKIATKPMTEQYILGELLGLIIEDAGYEVEITKGIGGGTCSALPRGVQCQGCARLQQPVIPEILPSKR